VAIGLAWRYSIPSKTTVPSVSTLALDLRRPETFRSEVQPVVGTKAVASEPSETDATIEVPTPEVVPDVASTKAPPPMVPAVGTSVRARLRPPVAESREPEAEPDDHSAEITAPAPVTTVGSLRGDRVIRTSLE
jgi:hypothetical protein